MKCRKTSAILLILTLLMLTCLTILPAAADDAWSWANYGFSGTAIANPDPFEKTSYLIGGYVTTVNHLNPLPQSYVYRSAIVLDTEGVAIRFRFSWTNSEPGYKAVADLADGIAIYPMDESLDILIVAEDGTHRFSFPAPAAYDYMKANDYTVMDDGQYMTVSVAGKTVAILRYSGTRTAGGKTCYEGVTVTDGSGYVYGRISSPLVLTDGGYAGYSSQESKALILVKSHTLSEADIDFDIPEEKETTDGWVPETEAPLTESVTEPENEPETEGETAAASENTTTAASETSALSAAPETDVADTASGCDSVIAGGAALLLPAAAFAVTMRCKKKD